MIKTKYLLLDLNIRIQIFISFQSYTVDVKIDQLTYIFVFVILISQELCELKQFDFHYTIYITNFRSIGWYIEILLMLNFSCAIFRHVKIVQSLSFCSLSLNHFMIKYFLWDTIRESKLSFIQWAPSNLEFKFSLRQY